MNTNEVCAYLNMSRPTLFKRIRDKRITPLPKNNPALDREPLRFARADVERLAQPAPAKADTSKE